MDNQTLSELHKVETEILEVVDSICKENGITYYFTGGTLLGAVRHKGFIPWDDDIDIVMPRADFQKFIEICNQGALGDNYFLHHISTDDNFYLIYAKIKKNNTFFDEEIVKSVDCHKGIFIDIFPLDYINADNKLLFKIKSLLKILAHCDG